MEALLSGVPALAVSIGAFGGDIDYRAAADFVKVLASNVFERGLPTDSLLNINVPALAADRIAGVEVTRLGKRVYRDQLVERLDPYGNPYYWVGGPAVSEEAEPGTDVAALRAGKISVTPIYLDLTSHALIDDLAKWDWGWSAPVAVSAD
jgi:5'-nucleotidase